MLQNWPIRRKLVVILVIPVLALALVSAFQVRGNLANVTRSQRVQALAGFSIKVGDLITALQNERIASSTLVGSGYRTGAANVTASRKPVDMTLASYRDRLARLPAGSRTNLGAALATVTTQLALLPRQRDLIDGRQAVAQSGSQYYTSAVADLLALDSQISAGSNNADLVARAATLVSVAEAQEAVSQQQGFVAVILFLHQATSSLVSQIQTNAGAQQAWLTQFRNAATPAERASYDRTMGTTDASMSALRDKIIQAVEARRTVTVDPQAWIGLSTQDLTKMRTVEQIVATDLSRRSSSIASTAKSQAWFRALLTLLVLALSLGGSLLVASPMIYRLRTLRRAALDVANNRLPALVEQLHHGATPDIGAESFPVSFRGTDEISQVAEAFSIVHKVAVETAVEQAAMRKSIGDTFLNLARRSQSLIHRQLKVIDNLERKETDPDELEELFRLDHLATRMRRHAEDLIVLSGAKPARGWRRPVVLKNVVRGAVAEVEDYTRVKLLPVSGPPVSGHAVGDVIHLLAELIENATSFSPPHTPVHISGHEVSKGSVIEIEDRGLGMTEDEFREINHRLSNPPPFDLGTSERLGLFVVGQLAERHNINVMLRSSPYGGTVAIVLLPNTLLRPGDPEANQVPDDTFPAYDDLSNGSGQLAAYDPLPVPTADRPGMFDGHSNGHSDGYLDASPLGAADGLGTSDGYRDADGLRGGPMNWRAEGLASDGPAPPVPRAIERIYGMSPRPASHSTGELQSQPQPQPRDPAPAEPLEQAAEQPRTTRAGLPKRRRRASLAPELRKPARQDIELADDASNGPPAPTRSLEEVRAMMSSFQTNFGRGMQDGTYFTGADEFGEQP
jgi:signal transduction histidine kinase